MIDLSPSNKSTILSMNAKMYTTVILVQLSNEFKFLCSYQMQLTVAKIFNNALLKGSVLVSLGSYLLRFVPKNDFKE